MYPMSEGRVHPVPPVQINLRPGMVIETVVLIAPYEADRDACRHGRRPRQCGEQDRMFIAIAATLLQDLERRGNADHRFFVETRENPIMDLQRALPRVLFSIHYCRRLAANLRMVGLHESIRDEMLQKLGLGPPGGRFPRGG